MDNYKAAKRIIEFAPDSDWKASLRACAHALVAMVYVPGDEEADESVDEFTVTGNVYDLADLHEKNRGLMSELDRMRSRLTQCHVENGKLKAELMEGRINVQQ